MSEELKPCPFCGAARTVGYCPEMNDEDYCIESIESCFRKAVEAWNRRANDGKID